MRALPLARQGDAHALLALAIVASGDHRDVASHAAYQQRVDQFGRRQTGVRRRGR